MTKRILDNSISRRSMLVGLGSAAVAGLAMPNLLIGGAKAQGKYKLDLGGYTGPEPTSQPITLRFMRQDFTPEVNALIEKAYAEFTAAYPNITITEEKVPYGDLQKKMQVYVSSGDAPDIMMGRTDFSEAYHAGQISVPMQQFFSKDYLEDFPAPLLEAASSHGNVYCLPWETVGTMLYFNRDIFEKAGIPTPVESTDLEAGWNVEDFLGTMEELTKKLRAAGDTQTWAVAAAASGNGGPGSNYTQLEAIWIRSQGDANAPKDSSAYKTLMGVSEDGRSATGYIDTPEAVLGMTNYQAMFSRKLTPLGAVPNQYPGGLAATYFGGLNYAMRFLGPNGNPGFRWGTTTTPRGKFVFTSNSSDSPLIWSKSKYQPEAAALLGYICNNPNRIAFHRAWGSLPARYSLRNEMEEFKTLQPFQLAAKLSTVSHGAPRTAGYFDYFNAMNPAVKDIALGADPQATLTDAAGKIDRLLAKYR